MVPFKVGPPPLSHPTSPLQALLALCLVGGAVAAPQLLLGGPRSVSRQVTSVSSDNQQEVGVGRRSSIQSSPRLSAT